jgi:hypothetical protein
MSNPKRSFIIRYFLLIIMLFISSLSCAEQLDFDSMECVSLQMDENIDPNAIKIQDDFRLSGAWRLSISKLQVDCDSPVADTNIKALNSSTFGLDTIDGEILYYTEAESPKVIGEWRKDKPFIFSFDVDDEETSKILPLINLMTLYVTHEVLSSSPSVLKGEARFTYEEVLKYSGQFELQKLDE